MILRAVVDKVRAFFGQAPIVDLQPQAAAMEQHDESYLALEQWQLKLIAQKQRKSTFNIHLAHRKHKSQKRNWKQYKKQRAGL